jgi:hypothetical protein
MKHTPEVIEAIKKRRDAMWPVLDERGRRWFAASEAKALGRGGAYIVEQALGVARSTINRGLKELAKSLPVIKKQRRPGGGRKKKPTSIPISPVT